MPLRARRRRRERRGRRRVCAPTLPFPPFPLPRQISIHPYQRGVSSLRSARVHMLGNPFSFDRCTDRDTTFTDLRSERERETDGEREGLRDDRWEHRHRLSHMVAIARGTWSSRTQQTPRKTVFSHEDNGEFDERAGAVRAGDEGAGVGDDVAAAPASSAPDRGCCCRQRPFASASATSPSVGTGLPSATFLAPPPPPPPPATTSGSQFSYPTAALPPPPPPPSAASSSSMFPVPFHLQQQYQAPPQYNPASSQSTYAAQPQPSQYQYPTLYQQPATSSTLAAEPTVYPLPQQQQAQKLFQRDAQTITPEALESVKAALASGEGEKKAETKKRAIPRKAAGQTWEDSTLAEWPDNDHRLFCGDLGNEVNDEVLTKAFTRFASFNMARVVRDKRTGKTKGFGFVSFSNPSDLALAFKEMNGKYVGNRPIKLRKSTWKERIDTEAQQHMKHKKRHKPNNPPPEAPQSYPA